jgi:putative hydrolase of the HAD superfamily
MQFKAIIFDLGDTLILTDQWNYDKCLIKLLESLQHNNVIVSISFEEFRYVYFEVRRQMYVESEQSLREVDFCKRIAETLRKFGCNFSHESQTVTYAVEVFFEAFIEDVRMEAYVPPLLKRLKEKYKLGLVSNFAYSQGFWKILQRFNLTRFFDVVVVSGELGLRKPHPRIFEEALKKLDVKAAEAVFVGDSLKADIDGARNMGLKTILVENAGLRKNPYATPGELDPIPIKPDITIPNLKNLPKILDIL